MEGEGARAAVREKAAAEAAERKMEEEERKIREEEKKNAAKEVAKWENGDREEKENEYDEFCEYRARAAREEEKGRKVEEEEAKRMVSEEGEKRKAKEEEEEKRARHKELEKEAKGKQAREEVEERLEAEKSEREKLRKEPRRAEQENAARKKPEVEQSKQEEGSQGVQGNMSGSTGIAVPRSGSTGTLVPRAQAQVVVNPPSPRWSGNASLSVVALYAYLPQMSDELRFAANDVIAVTGRSEDGWFWGHLNGRKGLVPANYVRQETREASSSSHRGQHPPPRVASPTGSVVYHGGGIYADLVGSLSASSSRPLSGLSSVVQDQGARMDQGARTDQGARMAQYTGHEAAMQRAAQRSSHSLYASVGGAGPGPQAYGGGGIYSTISGLSTISGPASAASLGASAPGIYSTFGGGGVQVSSGGQAGSPRGVQRAVLRQPNSLYSSIGAPGRGGGRVEV